MEEVSTVDSVRPVSGLPDLRERFRSGKVDDVEPQGWITARQLENQVQGVGIERRWPRDARKVE